MTQTIGRDEFKAAEMARTRAEKLAIHDARRETQRAYDAAVAQYAKEREPQNDADRIEITAAVDATAQIVRLAQQIEAQFDTLAKLNAADAPNPTDRVLLAELLADRFADDNLARAFLAGFKLEAGE